HGVNDIIGESCWMWACKSNSFQPLDLPARAKKFGECSTIPKAHAITVNVLSQQRDFQGPVVDERFNFSQNLTRTTVTFLSAQVRNDTKRAGIVTAHRDGDPTRIRGFALGRKRGREGF